MIDGAKQFITNAGTDISGVVCITARTGTDEISNLIVAERHPRLRAGRAVPQDGLERLRHAAARLRAARACPKRTCSARAAMGFKQFLQVLDIGRIGVAAMGVGLAQGALDEALAYAKERQAFGQSISKFQAIQIKLADMATEIEAARLLVYKAARQKDRERKLLADGGAGEAEDAGDWRCAAPRRRCRSTAATASSRSTRSAASIATPRSSPSARAPTRSSRW